jgi:hypothetical protein
MTLYTEAKINHKMVRNGLRMHLPRANNTINSPCNTGIYWDPAAAPTFKPPTNPTLKPLKKQPHLKTSSIVEMI